MVWLKCRIYILRMKRNYIQLSQGGCGVMHNVDYAELKRQCKELYGHGVSHKSIIENTGVKQSTLRSWIHKEKWAMNKIKTVKNKSDKKNKTKIKNTEVAAKTEKTTTASNLDLRVKLLRNDLMSQVEARGNCTKYFIDLVEDYIKMWEIKEMLIEDISVRGVQVEYVNGANQYGLKKNDSVAELIKYNAQMLKLINELGLKASDKILEKEDEGDDY